VRRSISPGQNPETPSPTYQDRTPSPPMPQPYPHVHEPTPGHPTDSPTSAEGSQPLPNVGAESEGPGRLDERSLNALAAREISKQMEVLPSPLSPPLPLFAGRKSVSPRPSFTPDMPPNNGTRLGRIPSPPPSQFTSSTLTRELASSPHLPQFQSQPPPPPVGALPQLRSLDSTASDLTQPDDVYRTPPEYHRNLSTPPSPSMTPVSPPPAPQITSTSSSSPSTPTTKKISAAAFRRVGMRGLSSNTNLKDDTLRQDSLSVGFRPSPGRSPSRERGEDENGDGSLDTAITPLNVRKKSLPAVPGISTNILSGLRGPGAPRSISSPFPNLRTSEEQPPGSGRVPPSSNSPDSRPRESTLGEDDFDLSAYSNEDERRQNVMHHGATNGHGHVGGGQGTGPAHNVGYGSGNFSTSLEE